MRAPRGFSLVELLIVIAIVAVGAALASWALPDGEAARLEEEGERLAALLDLARAESRVAGLAVLWVPRDMQDAGGPAAAPARDFRFVGLPAAIELPQHWLHAGVRAEVVGTRSLLLGPEAILPPQRVRLQLEGRQLELASDGLGGFAAVSGDLARDGAGR